LCNALEGKDLVPGEDGRVSVQKAWAHAADRTNYIAAQNGHRQVAVSAGLSSPIYMTRAGPYWADGDGVEAYRKTLLARYSEIVPFGFDRPVNLGRIYRDLAIYRQFSSPYFKSREELVRELSFEDRSDSLEPIRAKVHGAVEGLLARLEGVFAPTGSTPLQTHRRRARAIDGLLNPKSLIDELRALGSQSDLVRLLSAEISRDIVSGFLSDLGYEDGVFTRIFEKDLDRLPDDFLQVVGRIQARFPAHLERLGPPLPVRAYLEALQEERQQAADQERQPSRGRLARPREQCEAALAQVEFALLEHLLAGFRRGQANESLGQLSSRLRAWRDKVVWELQAFEDKKERVTFEFALAEYGRIVILGHPGSGKSTLLQYKTVEYARSPTGPLPVLFKLKALNGARSADLLPAIMVEVRRSGLADERQFVQIALEGKAIFFLDGLDEVVETIRGEVCDGIAELASRYPSSPLVVTSRVLGYHNFLSYRSMELADLTSDQIDSFLEVWFANSYLDPEAAVEGVRSSRRLSRLCRNPFLLTLYAIVCQRRPNTLPSRSALFALATSILLETGDRSKGLSRNRLPLSAKQKFLKRIARALHARGRELFEEADVLKFEDRRGPPAAEMLTEIVNNSGIVRQLSAIDYGFAHLSLLEYFAALACKRDEGFVQDRLTTPRFWEMIRLWCGCASVQTVTAVLGAAINSAGQSGWRDVSFLASCVAEMPRPPTAYLTRLAAVLLAQLEDLETDTGVRAEALDRLIELYARDDERALTPLLEQSVGRRDRSVEVGVSVILAAEKADDDDALVRMVERLRDDRARQVVWLIERQGSLRWMDVLRRGVATPLAASCLSALGMLARKHHVDIRPTLQALLEGQVTTKDRSDGFLLRLSRDIAPGAQPAAERLLDAYLQSVQAYTQREKVRNPFTFDHEDPDERLMRWVEEVLGVPEDKKDDMRREMMTYLGARFLTEGVVYFADTRIREVIARADERPWVYLGGFRRHLWDPARLTVVSCTNGVRVGEDVLFPGAECLDVIKHVCSVVDAYFQVSYLELAFHDLEPARKGLLIPALSRGLFRSLHRTVLRRASIRSFARRLEWEAQRHFPVAGAPPPLPGARQTDILRRAAGDLGSVEAVLDLVLVQGNWVREGWAESANGKALLAQFEKTRTSDDDLTVRWPEHTALVQRFVARTAAPIGRHITRILETASGPGDVELEPDNEAWQDTVPG
jgi:hypothetical protein